MKRREFLITSAMGSSLAANPILATTGLLAQNPEPSKSRAGRRGKDGLTTPRLFFSQADVLQLRRDVAGVKQPLWKRVREAADRDLQTPPLQPDTSSDWAIRELCTIDREQLVRRCAFAYLITGDGRRSSAIAVLLVCPNMAQRTFSMAGRSGGRFGSYGLCLV